MAIQVTRIEGVDVLTLAGRFDAHTVPAVNNWLGQAFAILPPQVAINMHDVNFVDSAGLATFVKGMKRTRELGGNMVLFGVQQPVRIIFELTRLDKAIEIYDDREKALASFKQAYTLAG